MARICWGHSTGCFIYSFVIPAVISKKTLSSKGFSWQFQKKFYMKIIANIIPNRFSCKFAFIIFFLSFLSNQRQESGFRQVGGLITRNISVFLWITNRALLKAMSNSIDSYKWFFSHVISVRIIVPWQNENFIMYF